jgi:hypothetical protein
MVSRVEDLPPSRTTRPARFDVVIPAPGRPRNGSVESDDDLLRDLGRTLQGMASELADLSRQTRGIAREEVRAARGKILQEARAVAREEAGLAPAGSRYAAAPRDSVISWSMALIALFAAAALVLAAGLAGWAGAVAAAVLFAMASTFAMARA